MSDRPNTALGTAYEASPAAPKIDPAQTQVALEQTFERPLTACCWDPLDRFVVV